MVCPCPSLDGGERGGLVVNASDSGSDPEVGGSSPAQVKPCCVLEQGTFTPQKYGNTQEGVAPSQHD